MLRGTIISRRRADWKSRATIVLICFLLPGFLRAQAPQPPLPPPVTQESAAPRLPQEALNQLLAPIALYPDALVAVILPASTVPSDVVLATRFISSNGDPAQVANQPWDDSVKSLIRYPDVLRWMDQNLEWTTQVGVAFLDQPADVMNTIQQLRAQAIAAGNLTDCPQQRVVKEENCIRIVPAEPEVIYVPRYDPEVVYVQPYPAYVGPALSFGVGFAAGSWLNYDCDWPRRRVCVGEWNPRWRNDWNPGWKHKWKRNRGNHEGNTINVVSISSDTARIWQPSAKIQRQQWKRERNYNDNQAVYYNGNARIRGGNADDPGRRFAAVAKPTRLGFDGRTGEGDGRASRRLNSEASNLAGNLPGEIRDPRGFQSEQLSRGNSNREWKGKGRGKEQSGYQSNAIVKQQQFKAGRAKSSDSQSSNPSYSKASKHSMADGIERSKGGSKHSAASNSKPKKTQSAGTSGKKSGGGGNKGGEKGGKGKGKDKG